MDNYTSGKVTKKKNERNSEQQYYSWAEGE